MGSFTGTGNINPLLGPLADNGGCVLTHALSAGSPAIDTGIPDPSTFPSTDARGLPRPQDRDENGTATCDMGAFEYLKVFIAIVTR